MTFVPLRSGTMIGTDFSGSVAFVWNTDMMVYRFPKSIPAGQILLILFGVSFFCALLPMISLGPTKPRSLGGEVHNPLRFHAQKHPTE